MKASKSNERRSRLAFSWKTFGLAATIQHQWRSTIRPLGIGDLRSILRDHNHGWRSSWHCLDYSVDLSHRPGSKRYDFMAVTEDGFHSKLELGSK